MPTERKAQIVDEISEKFSNASSIIVADYSGMDVPAISSLRRKFYDADVEFRVVKNTFSRLAAKNANIPEELTESFSGQTAFIFGFKDPVSPAKILKDFLKNSEKPVFKSCYFEGNVIDEAGFKQIAALPSREELLAKLLGGLQDPLRKIQSVLQDSMRKVVTVFNALKEQKQ